MPEIGGKVLLKAGCEFAVIAPGGYVLLWALKRAAQAMGRDLTITAGTNGDHDPNSRHYKGEAYDVRTHDLTEEEKARLLECLKDSLLDRFGAPRFYYFLEGAHTANEHLHMQVRKGTGFTVQDLLKWPMNMR